MYCDRFYQYKIKTTKDCHPNRERMVGLLTVTSREKNYRYEVAYTTGLYSIALIGTSEYKYLLDKARGDVFL